MSACLMDHEPTLSNNPRVGATIRYGDVSPISCKEICEVIQVFIMTLDIEKCHAHIRQCSQSLDESGDLFILIF